MFPRSVGCILAIYLLKGMFGNGRPIQKKKKILGSFYLSHTRRTNQIFYQRSNSSRLPICARVKKKKTVMRAYTPPGRLQCAVVCNETFGGGKVKTSFPTEKSPQCRSFCFLSCQNALHKKLPLPQHNLSDPAALPR